MGTLATIGLILLAIIIIIGIIRVIVSPYTGFGNFLMEVLLIDCLGDILEWFLDALGDSDWDLD